MVGKLNTRSGNRGEVQNGENGAQTFVDFNFLLIFNETILTKINTMREKGIHLEIGDITKLKVDAIVNAANTTLSQ